MCLNGNSDQKGDLEQNTCVHPLRWTVGMVSVIFFGFAIRKTYSPEVQKVQERFFTARLVAHPIYVPLQGPVSQPLLGIDPPRKPGKSHITGSATPTSAV